MNNEQTILEELQALGSQLQPDQATTYQVPASYFYDLPTLMLTRIKALQAETAVEELAILSPVLSALPKAMPFAIPGNYFAELAGKGLLVASIDDPAKELEAISPLLGSLKKTMPYSLPEGYFESVAKPGRSSLQPKLVSVTGKQWFRMAAAAVLLGLIVTTGFLFKENKKVQASGSKVMAKFTRDIRKMNDAQKVDLIDFIDAGMSANETAQTNVKPVSNEVKVLLQDVSAEELDNFQQQTEDVQDVLMTN